MRADTDGPGGAPTRNPSSTCGIHIGCAWAWSGRPRHSEARGASRFGAGDCGSYNLRCSSGGRWALGKTARLAAGRQTSHHVQRLGERGAAGSEVAFEEQLGEPGLRVTLDVLADLVERTPERSAVLPLGCVVDAVGAAADDVQLRGVSSTESR